MNEKQRVLLLVLAVVSISGEGVRFEHQEEWQLWKTEHGKSYQSQREELERHVVWLSNREYINSHNENSIKMGFSLRLNHFADMVS